jgi:AcrR family transcriptional regulator
MKRIANKTSSKAASRASREQPVRQRARRLPAGERRALIMKEAAVFFSEHGFSASTRDLADRLGVRQALLYKYFTSKEALIDVVFNETFAEQWAEKWAGVMSSGKGSLAERLREFYAFYSDDPDNLRLRLFLRGALDGWPTPRKLMPLVEKHLVIPVVEALRAEAGLPALSTKPMFAGERELVMALHGAVVFSYIRAGIYKMDGVDRAAVTGLYVDNFLRGARDSLRALHDGALPAALSATA